MNKLRTGIAGTYLALCLLLGGASAAGASANALLQLLGLGLLLLHLWSRGAPPLPREGRWLLALGLIFAALLSVPLQDQGFVLSYPVGQLVFILVVAALAGVIAAIAPARRAARLDVLQALAYE